MQQLTLGDGLSQTRQKTYENFIEDGYTPGTHEKMGSGQGLNEWRDLVNLYAGRGLLFNGDMLWYCKKRLNIYFGVPEPNPPYGPQELPNGNFDSEEFWTLGDGWSISGGKLHCDGTQTAESTACSITGPLYVDEVYRVTMGVTTVDAGSFTPKVGPDVTDGTAVTTAGYQIQEVTASSGANVFCLVADVDFVGSIEFVSMNKEANTLWEEPTMHVGSADGTNTSASIGYHGDIAWVDQGTVAPTKVPLDGLNVNSADDIVNLYYTGAAKPHPASVELSGTGVTTVRLDWNGTRYVGLGADWWQFLSDNFNTDIVLGLTEVP